ncbi:MAG: hypothetical protein ACFFCQ_15455 [Promethearchaeota archaeon]
MDNPYTIDGEANNRDIFPLVSPAVLDSDGDGMPDFYEILMGLNPNLNDAGGDVDQDGLNNLEEYHLGAHINDADSDDDGLTDGNEVKIYTTDPLKADSDRDGMPDGWEVEMGVNPLINDSNSDPDNDGILNFNEYQYGTHPFDPDSDSDGIPDRWKIKYNLNPLINDAANDPDKDGLTNLHEYKTGTNPYDSDSDNHFFSDRSDNGWWGNPRVNWDNPLTRGLLFILLPGLLGLGVWAGFIAIQLPKLQQNLNLLFLNFQQYTHQFQENITAFQNQENLEDLEAAADQIYLAMQSYEDFFLFIQHFVNRRWLPSFLRPDLTPWEMILATMKHTFEEFQQIRLKRLDAKY